MVTATPARQIEAPPISNWVASANRTSEREIVTETVPTDCRSAERDCPIGRHMDESSSEKGHNHCAIGAWGGQRWHHRAVALRDDRERRTRGARVRPALPARPALLRRVRPGRPLLRRVRPGRRTLMVCESCELTGGPFSAAEAAALLWVHKQLHHGLFQPHGTALPSLRD
jgi:hypothetical protein